MSLEALGLGYLTIGDGLVLVEEGDSIVEELSV